MESRSRSSTTVGRAAAEVLERGRVYSRRGRYTSLVVFYTERSAATFLEDIFGGHVYKHRVGYVWVLSRFRDLVDLYHHLPDSTLKTRLKESLLLAGRPLGEAM